MKVLLDIKDSKAAFVMQLLGSLAYVKAKALTEPKAKFMEELKEAVENVKLAKAGKLKTKSLDQLLDEL